MINFLKVFNMFNKGVSAKIRDFFFARKNPIMEQGKTNKVTMDK